MSTKKPATSNARSASSSDAGNRSVKKKKAAPRWRAQADIAPAAIIVRPNNLPAVLGIGRRTAERLRKQGLFPQPVLLGGGAGYLMSDLLAWAQSQQRVR